MRKLSPFLLASFACTMLLVMQMTSSVSAQGTPGDLPVPAIVGDLVWHDVDKDGIQDDDEPGIPNIMVHLIQSGMITRTTETDEEGLYLFDNLPAGTYTIKIDLASIPYVGYYFTQPDAGADDVDSEASPIGQIEAITLTADGFDLSQDIGIVFNAGVIGNYVWLDEDGNGDQDPGEGGLSNVVVELLDGSDNVIAQTLSDLNGGYIFKDLTGDNYTVRIDPDSLPDGARWREVVVNGDLGNQDPDGTSVGLMLGQEQMGGDFGIFWGHPTENTGDGALGGRVWSDADGDGSNDPGEAGIGGVTVSLMGKTSGLQRTIVTDPSGFYLFDGLPAGVYTITIDAGPDTPLANSSSSFDPDNISRPQLEPNNRTDAPLILAPGDLYAYADFGYRLEGSAAVSGTIITRIYVDTNGNGEFDEGLRINGTVVLPAVPIGEMNNPILVLGNEPGFANVTISLANEMNEIVATTRSDANGVAEFTGLTPGTYYVLVSDVDNILGEIVPFGEPDEIFDGETLIVLTADETERAEFGYAPAGHNSDAAILGDFVYFDVNGNGKYDNGEGLEGIGVQLLDADGNAFPPILTNENGGFFFGNITESGRYTIKIDPSTVPSGFVNTIDPDGGTPLEAEIVLQDSTLINLAGADFGFTAETDAVGSDVTGSISGNIWDDVNVDGILNDFNLGNTNFGGVSVDLYSDVDMDGQLDQSNGDRFLVSVVTDINGAFRFDNLPTDNQSYIVSVNDQAGLLANYWSIVGSPSDENNRSQESPYRLVLTPEKPTNDTADFGYSRGLGAIGNRIWFDSNDNGIQDVGDTTGLTGTIVVLSIIYPQQTIQSEVDASSGVYEFYGLGADESYLNEGDIAYKLTVKYDESMYAPAKIDAIPNELLDSDDPKCEYVTPVRGQYNLTLQSDPIAETIEASYDFGFIPIEWVEATTITLKTTSAITITHNMLFIVGLLGVLLLSTTMLHKRYTRL